MRYVLLLAAVFAAPAAGQNPEPAPAANLAVTIYNDDLALVEDTRQVDLPVGRARQEFPGVSGRISPGSVSLSGRDVGIVEQNFDFDLLSPSKMVEKAVAEEFT